MRLDLEGGGMIRCDDLWDDRTGLVIIGYLTLMWAYLMREGDVWWLVCCVRGVLLGGRSWGGDVFRWRFRLGEREYLGGDFAWGGELGTVGETGEIGEMSRSRDCPVEQSLSGSTGSSGNSRRSGRSGRSRRSRSTGSSSWEGRKLCR